MRVTHSQKRPLMGANLCASGQNARLRLSVLGLAMGLGMTIFMAEHGWERVWRLTTFLPFLVAAMAACQGLYRVCPMLSMDGCRESADGPVVPQECDQAAKAAKAAAGCVLRASIVMAVSATLVVTALP
ncbi:MAG: hypothetical protein KTR25_12105 [Myxococcales bacterium]|nr:hypothetical protein [Myxococcales bacterium]